MWAQHPDDAVARIVEPYRVDGLDDDEARLLGNLTRRLRGARRGLIEARTLRQAAFDEGRSPGERPSTRWLRVGGWRCRTGPEVPSLRLVPAADRAAYVNALLAGPYAVADLEDGLAPTFGNVQAAHRTVADVVERYPEMGMVVLRPRGLHLEERHVQVDGEAVPAALYDVGRFLRHAAAAARGGGLVPCVLLPKLEGLEDAYWFADLLRESERWLGLSANSVSVVATVETLPAAIDVEEILFALRERVLAVRLGLQDFVFSMIKVRRSEPRFVAPAPAFDDDTVRELVDRVRRVSARRGVPVLDDPAEGGSHEDVGLTLQRLRRDVDLGVRYLAGWLGGQGTVDIDGQPCVAAHAERCRAVVWQGVHHGRALDDGRPVSPGLLADLLAEVHAEHADVPRVAEAAQLFRELVVAPTLAPFFTEIARPHEEVAA